MDLINNEKVVNYINLVCSKIKFKDIHENIKVELLDHLDCIVEKDMDKGNSLEEAIDLGIKQMGDPYILGEKLNKVHKPKPEWSILVLTSIFTFIGIISLYVMSFYELADGINISGVLEKSLTMVIVGTLLVVALYFFDYRKIKPFSKYLYIATSILLIILLLMGERFVNFGVFKIVRGRLMFFSTDFTYITPFLYAIALSGIFSKDRWEKGKTLVNLVILLLPIALIISFQSSITTSIIMYLSMTLVLMFISGAGIKYILGIIGSGIVSLALLIFNQSYSYRIERLKNFLNPLPDPLDSGYVNVQLRKLISSAGFLGNRINIDKTEVPILDLPEMRTDYIFSYIVHAFGWIAGISIIVLSFVFFIRLIKAIKDIEDSYGKLLVATFSSLFIVQFVYNILMVLGLVPVAGISLPFISYGTTLNMVNMIMIGIISSVYRRKDVSEEVVV